MSKEITRKMAIEYQCWECMGYYYDGKNDCECVRCPLYAFMPYRRLEPDFWFKTYSPRHKGLTSIEDTKRDLSDEERQKLAERMKRLKKDD